MNDLLNLYVSISLSASLPAVILILLRPLYKEAFSRRWQYYIWLVVIIRLLLPFHPVDGIVSRLFQEMHLTAAHWKIPQELGKAGLQNMTKEIPGQTENSPEETEASSDPAQTLMNGESETMSDAPALYRYIQMLLEHIWIVWLSVAFFLLIRKATIYQSFVKYLRAGSVAVDDIERLDALGKIMEQNRIRRMTGLYTNSLTASPLLIGFFHPSIILTNADISDTDFHYTVLHEIMHYRRRDMFYKWLVQLALCLHWFNPLVYLMEREISRSCELSCDEAVIKNLDAEGKRDYGNTLLHAMGAGGIYKNTLASLTLHENSKLLKERLGAIMNNRKKTGAAMVLSAVCALLVAGSAVVMGAYLQPAAAEQVTDRIRLSDCKMIQKDGIYYILYPGATKEDMPSGGVTDGCICITLVQKDAYTAVGPFDDTGTLVHDVTQQITFMREKDCISEEGAQLLTEAAEKIQKNASGISINKTSVTLAKGKTAALKLTGTKRQAVWFSDNQKIASVSKKGIVTAKKAGRTKITALLDGQTYLCTVKVTGKAANNTLKKNTENKDTVKKDTEKKEKTGTEAYQALGITEKNGAYFYKGSRIRIFMDIRANKSFANFRYDKNGTIDIKLRRSEDSSISGVEYLSKKEAEEILQDMETPDAEVHTVQPEISVSRLDKNELPDEVAEAVSSCKAGTWYVIKSRGLQYVYYHGLPYNYAFEPTLNEQKAEIRIVDIKSSRKADVLLAVRSHTALTIRYHDRKVSCQTISL